MRRSLIGSGTVIIGKGTRSWMNTARACPESAAQTLMRGPSDLQIIEDAFGGLAPLVNGRDHQIRAAHHVATGKDLGVLGLKQVLGQGRTVDADAAVLVQVDLVAAEPFGRAPRRSFRPIASSSHSGLSLIHI